MIKVWRQKKVKRNRLSSSTTSLGKFMLNIHHKHENIVYQCSDTLGQNEWLLPGLKYDDIIPLMSFD